METSSSAISNASKKPIRWLNNLYFRIYSIITTNFALEFKKHPIMMKKIRNTVNVVLSAIIVALGFGSCGVSQKTYNEAMQEIERLNKENASLNQEVQSLRQQMDAVKEYQRPFRLRHMRTRIIRIPSWLPESSTLVR